MAEVQHAVSAPPVKRTLCAGTYYGVTLGGDPELFLTDDSGKPIGSERVIPEGGLKRLADMVTYVKPVYEKDAHGYPKYYTAPLEPGYYKKPDGSRCTAEEEALIASEGYSGTVIRDGIQVEINTGGHSCRAQIGNDIAAALRRLRTTLALKGGKADFSGVVEVPKEELEALSEQSRKLGCAPSHNAHDASASVNVNPMEYRKRSAGGHIHIGGLPPEIWAQDRIDPKSYDYRTGRYLKNLPDVDRRAEVVPVLDIILGNTCVLIDRDPGAAERRKVYGRAGEYRLPKHGLEYRTLSNFWLRHYALTSFVMGMARMAVRVVQEDSIHRDLLMKSDIGKVVHAINTNDYDLAMENFKAIEPWFREYAIEPAENSAVSNTWQISSTKVDDFLFFTEKIREAEKSGSTQPLSFWFPDDPMTYWCEKYRFGNEKNLPKVTVASIQGFSDSGHIHGWDTFVLEEIRPKRLAKQEVKVG